MNTSKDRIDTLRKDAAKLVMNAYKNSKKIYKDDPEKAERVFQQAKQKIIDNLNSSILNERNNSVKLSKIPVIMARVTKGGKRKSRKARKARKARKVRKSRKTRRR